MRLGELAALRRADVDLEAAVVTVSRSLAELKNGRLVTKTPKEVVPTLVELEVAVPRPAPALRR